jgi:hypothetical protein
VGQESYDQCLGGVAVQAHEERCDEDRRQEDQHQSQDRSAPSEVQGADTEGRSGQQVGSELVELSLNFKYDRDGLGASEQSGRGAQEIAVAGSVAVWQA